MQSTFKSFTITAQTAWSTLQICDRQARKDCGKVARFSYSTYLVLTSTQAKQTYRTIWNAVVILAMIVWAIIVTIGNIADAFVEDCTEQPTVEAIAVPEETEPTAEAVHVPTGCKFPAFNIISVHEVERAPIALLPAAQYTAKPAKKQKRSRKGGLALAMG